jgi:hypothetical protein
MNIGQLRASDISDYGNKNGTLSYKLTARSVSASGGNYYSDTMFQLVNNLDSSRCYCLTFRVNALNTQQTINIRLKHDSWDNDIYQNIKTITLSAGENSGLQTVVFQPNANYNQIVFVLNRDENDTISTGGVLGRKVQINNDDTNIYTLTNVIETLATSKYPSLVTMKQIGVRGRSGLPMCINGEEIKIGPNRVYEINNGATINYLGFVVDDTTATGNDFFILDFLY